MHPPADSAKVAAGSIDRTDFFDMARGLQRGLHDDQYASSMSPLRENLE
jgi:hypothetical protein